MSTGFKPDPTSVLRAMARNYTARHCWDDLDVRACIMAADEIDRLRATPAPGAPGQEAAAVQAVDADAKDAARYRWLREQSHPWGRGVWMSLGALDDRIDAALGEKP